jgi:hypothetical protein
MPCTVREPSETCVLAERDSDHTPWRGRLLRRAQNGSNGHGSRTALHPIWGMVLAIGRACEGTGRGMREMRGLMPFLRLRSVISSKAGARTCGLCPAGGSHQRPMSPVGCSPTTALCGFQTVQFLEQWAGLSMAIPTYRWEREGIAAH